MLLIRSPASQCRRNRNQIYTSRSTISCYNPERLRDSLVAKVRLKQLQVTLEEFTVLYAVAFLLTYPILKLSGLGDKNKSKFSETGILKLE